MNAKIQDSLSKLNSLLSAKKDLITAEFSKKENANPTLSHYTAIQKNNEEQRNQENNGIPLENPNESTVQVNENPVALYNRKS